jgi:hypothetical protein
MRPGGERRRLDHAPGDRFLAVAAAPAGAGEVGTRGRLLATLIALVGGTVFFVLGQLTLGPGLLAVAAFTGWLTAVGLVDLGGGVHVSRGAGRFVIAVGLAGGAILAAILLDWAWAAMQGGVLGPLDYVGERYGPMALVDIGAAALLAGLHAR